MNNQNTMKSYDALSTSDKAIFDYVKKLNPTFSEEQLWESYEKRKVRIEVQRLIKQIKTKPYTTSSNIEHRTKTKDAIMKTIIYGGGFVTEAVASVALGALCAAVQNPHAQQMWMGSKNARKEHKDKAWDTYCRTGSMTDGFAALINME